MIKNVSSGTGKVIMDSETVDVTAGPIAGAIRVRWKLSARE